MGEFPETKELEEDLGFGAQDKISLKSNAKGDLQAEVRIGGKIIDEASLDNILKLQESAWKKLKEKFPNLKLSEGGEK